MVSARWDPEGVFRIIAPPRGLGRSTFWLLACALLTAFEAFLVSHAPWWKVPWRELAMAGGAGLALAIVFMVALNRGRPGALSVLTGLAAFWVLVSAGISLRQSNPALGFFSLGLALYWSVLIPWIRHNLNKPYLDPGLAWYEGLAEPIFGLQCRVGDAALKVAAFNREGAFLVSEHGLPPAFDDWVARKKKDRRVIYPLTFLFRDHEIQCDARLVSLHAEAGSDIQPRVCGLGVQFADLPADRAKELGEFVEGLQGAGYAY